MRLLILESNSTVVAQWRQDRRCYYVDVAAIVGDLFDARVEMATATLECATLRDPDDGSVMGSTYVDVQRWYLLPPPSEHIDGAPASPGRKMAWRTSLVMPVPAPAVHFTLIRL